MPLKFRFTVDTQHTRRRFDVLSRRASDWKPALNEFKEYMAPEVAARFSAEGPGWPGRATSDGAAKGRREADVRKAAVRALRRRMTYDVLRAQRRVDRGKGTERALENRKAALQRLDHLLEAGSRIDVTQLAGGDKRFLRNNRAAVARIEHAKHFAGAKLLGKIADSIEWTVAGATLVGRSTIPWAAAQQDGATVGRGSKLPPRPFLYFAEENADVLVEILRRHLLVE